MKIESQNSKKESPRREDVLNSCVCLRVSRHPPTDKVSHNFLAKSNSIFSCERDVCAVAGYSFVFVSFDRFQCVGRRCALQKKLCVSCECSILAQTTICGPKRPNASYRVYIRHWHYTLCVNICVRRESVPNMYQFTITTPVCPSFYLPSSSINELVFRMSASARACVCVCGYMPLVADNADQSARSK